MAEDLTAMQIRVLLEKQCREIGLVVNNVIPAGTAFALIFADFGEGGNTAYFSNANRQDMIKLLKELIGKLEGE